MKKVLLLGGTGLLGNYLSQTLNDFEIIVHGFTTKSNLKFDILDTSEVSNQIDRIKPDIIINLIALTNVDKCELNPHKSYLLNVKPVEILKWIKENNNFHLIQISTDQVYDGEGPHKEENIILTNYYAYSKYMSELVASSINATVLRTNFFGKSKLHNRLSFSDWLFQVLHEQKEINLFTDVFFSPLSMKTLSEIIQLVLNNPISGTFNLGSKNGMCKRDFAYQFADILGLSTNCFIDSTSEKEKLKAYRPKDMRMDVRLFESVFNITLPDLITEINLIKEDYINHESL